MRTTSKHPIFRRNAIEHYLRNKEKDIFPRFVSLPTFIFLWLLLGLFVLLIGMTWQTRVPTYVQGTGVVVSPPDTTTLQSAPGPVKGVLFMLPQQVVSIHRGMSVKLQVGISGPQLSGTVDTVGSRVISPDEAYKNYPLNKSAIPITEPTIVVTVRLPDALTANYTGSLLNGQIQTGSQSLLSLLPGIGPLFKS